MKRAIILLYAPDGAAMAAELRGLLAADAELAPSPAVSLLENPTAWPDTWAWSVTLALMSPDAFSDDDFHIACTEAARRMDIIPVVSSPNYDFAGVPLKFQMLSDRNACTPANVPHGLRGYLGLASFAAGKQVFISYARTDKDVAVQVENFLWDQRCPAFRDETDIAPGAMVQAHIMKNIADKDFVLLLDSPAAATRRWVEDEIVEAQRRCIPICVLQLGDRPAIGQVAGAPRVQWDGNDTDRLYKVWAAVSRALAGRTAFDVRVDRVVQEFARRRGLQLHKDGRRFRLASGGIRVLVEYEDAAVSLERLHRLSLGYREKTRCAQAIYVSSDISPARNTREALVWARRKERLEVTPLAALVSTLHTLFPDRAPL